MNAQTPPIRPAASEDVDALLTIEAGAFPGDRLSRRAFRHAVASRSIVALVTGADMPLGYVLVETRRGARVARLSSLAVAPAAAGLGLGRRLLAAAEAAVLARGCDRLRLEVRSDNGGAIALYGKAGYRQIGRRLRYYEDGKAALRFEKTLG